jgi:hypothetical protein
VGKGQNKSQTSLMAILQVAASFLSLPEAKRGVTPKSVQVYGVNFTKIRFVPKLHSKIVSCLTTGMEISDKVHRVVDKFCTGGTQIFQVEGA